MNARFCLSDAIIANTITQPAGRHSRRVHLPHPSSTTKRPKPIVRGEGERSCAISLPFLRLSPSKGCVYPSPAIKEEQQQQEQHPHNHHGVQPVIMDSAVVAALRAVAQKKDKAECQQGLQRYQNQLACLPLEEASVEVEQALKDIVRERVLLNGVEFAGESDMLLETLSKLCERLAAAPVVQELGLTARGIYEAVLRKSSRTTSGSDSYFTLQNLFGTPELVLKPRFESRPSLEINLYLSEHDLESEVIATNPYALYDVFDIDNFTQASGSELPSPWLAIDTEVVDKTDHRTKRNIRYLRINSPIESEVGLPSSVVEAGGDKGGSPERKVTNK